MFTYTCLCLWETDSELRFHSDRSWKSTPDQWVLTIISDQLIRSQINWRWLEDRLPDSLSVLIEKIRSSGRWGSGRWSSAYFICADQLTIVVDGVVVLPPVPKPIWVAMRDSSWSRLARRDWLDCVSCFWRSSNLCHSVELSTICWLIEISSCCLFCRSLYCLVFIQMMIARPNASTAST